MNDLAEHEWAYLAGFVDGDGFITVGLDSQGYPYQAVGLTQKDEDYLRMWMDKLGLGGHIQCIEGSFGSSSVLRFSRVPSRLICINIVPYLRLKRDKALEAIERENISSEYLLWEDRSKEMLWPYLAGLIDAEGTIGVYKNKSSVNGKYYDVPRLHIPQADRQLLDRLCEEIGFGSVIRRGKSGIGTQMYYLSFGSKQVRKIIECVNPYLIIKSSDADKVLDHKKKVRVDSATDRPEAKEAKRLYESGLSAAEVARQLGHKPATVNYWLRQMGLTRSYKQAQQLRRAKEGVDGN